MTRSSALPAAAAGPSPADMAAQVYSLLRRTPWHRHAKLVMVTPEGLRLTQPESQLLPPLSGLSVQSMADFSRRIAQEGQPELDPLLPPVSYEGGERRCFQTAFFCGRNLPMAAGLSPAEEAHLGQEAVQERLAAEVPDEPYSYGQALAAYLKQQRQQRVWQRQPTMPLPDAISLQQAAEAAGGGAFEQAASSGRLKIALMKRSGEGRQILNSVELMQRCNAWKYIQPGSNAPITAECYEVGLQLGSRRMMSSITADRSANANFCFVCMQSLASHILFRHRHSTLSPPNAAAAAGVSA